MSDVDKPTKGRKTALIGWSASVLIHVIGFWLLIDRTQLVVKPLRDVAPPLSVTLLPPRPTTPSIEQNDTAVTPEKKPAPPPSQKPIKKPRIEPRHTPPRIAKAPAPAIQQQTVIPKNEPPADDMFTQLEAARRRRAQAQENAPDAARESSERAATNNDNSIARANVATSLRLAGRGDQTESGGVFEVRHLGYRTAEVLFRGWSTSAHRDRTRLIEVEQGAEPDIQTAVVKRMIDVIREERSGDFIWESHRLNREITLSARPQDTAQLQQFLMKEFFPDYYGAGRKG